MEAINSTSEKIATLISNMPYELSDQVTFVRSLLPHEHKVFFDTSCNSAGEDREQWQETNRMLVRSLTIMR